MPAFEYFSEELLQPISTGQPCGVDIRYDPLFTDIAEARRADDDLSEGEWQKDGGRKAAEWSRLAELCLAALRHKSKDLRIAGYLTEAALRLDGFVGLRAGLRLTTELLRRFWDDGLFPVIEDGDMEYRASALVWLSNLLPEIVGQIPLTARTNGENYGFIRYIQAQRVGSESAIANVSAEKRETIQGLKRQGWITMDEFEAALRATKRKALEAIYEPFDQADEALRELDKITDERFGADAPTFSAAKETMSAIRRVLAPAIRKKQDEEPDQPVPSAADSRQASETSSPNAPVSQFNGGAPTAFDGKGWDDAAALIQLGKVDQGLAQMAAMAAQETSGRGRFIRKLMLSDVCLANGRNRLARTVLEELNQQITEFKLERWESSGLVGAVWSRLYKLYRKTEDGADQTKARDLYKQLGELDPWQAYISCED